MTSATITVTPSGQACGATVTGLDLSRPLDPGKVAEVRAAWLEHHVLAFPDQVISDDDQERFTLAFGGFGEDPFIAPIPGRQHVIAVKRLAGETSPLFAETWHSDWSFQARPPAGTFPAPPGPPPYTPPPPAPPPPPPQPPLSSPPPPPPPSPAPLSPAPPRPAQPSPAPPSTTQSRPAQHRPAPPSPTRPPQPPLSSPPPPPPPSTFPPPPPSPPPLPPPSPTLPPPRPGRLSAPDPGTCIAGRVC